MPKQMWQITSAFKGHHSTERDRLTDTDRQTQTDRQTDRDRDRQRQRQTDRQRRTEIERHIESDRDEGRKSVFNVQSTMAVIRGANERQTETDRETDKHTDFCLCEIAWRPWRSDSYLLLRRLAVTLIHVFLMERPAQIPTFNAFSEEAKLKRRKRKRREGWGERENTSGQRNLSSLC